MANNIPKDKTESEFNLLLVKDDVIEENVDKKIKERKGQSGVGKKGNHLLVFFISLAVLTILGLIAREIGKSSEPNLLDKLKVESTKKRVNYENELRQSINNTKKKLPKAVTTYMEWTNITLKADYVELIHVVYDVNALNLFEIDLNEYKEKIEKYLSSQLDRRLLEACVKTNRGINYHIKYSQSAAAKGYVNITFGNHEIEGILDGIDLK